MSVDRIEARRRGAAIQPGEAEDRSNQSNQSNQPAGSMSDADRIEARRRGAAIQPGEAGGEDQSNQNAQSDRSDQRPSVEDPIRARIEARQADQVAPAAAGGERIAGTVVEPVSKEQLATARQAVSDDAGRRARWDAMMRQLGVEPPEDKETRRKREKREKWARISAAIGDGISAFANLWSTTQYGPNSRFVSASDRLGERYRAEKEERDKTNDAYFRAWQWFDKRERDQAAADAAQKAAEWDRQLKEREQRRKENKDKEDGARKEKELERKIAWGDADNDRKNAKNEREEKLLPYKIKESQANAASGFSRAEKNRVQAERVRQQIRNGEQFPDLHLPSGEVIRSSTKAEYDKNVRLAAERYGIGTSWKDKNESHQFKSSAMIHAEIEHLMDWPETALVMGRKDASFRDFYDALRADGFDPGMSMEALAKELSTTKGRQIFFDRMAKAGVPVPRLKKGGNEVPDYHTWATETPWLKAPTTGAGAKPGAAARVDTARRAAEPVLVPVRPAVADKADVTDVADVTDEPDESVSYNEREQAEGGRGYTHTEGLFK